MNVYRNKKDKQLYTLEHLVLDHKHLNNNHFAGIYAYPYKHTGYKMWFKSEDEEACMKYVEEEFDKEFEIRKL